MLNGNTELIFNLDDQVVGSFISLAQTTYQYNVPVYANTSIPSGFHTLTLQNGLGNNETSLVLLDYMIYSHEDNSESQPISFPGSPISMTSTSSDSALSTPPVAVASTPLGSTSSTGTLVGPPSSSHTRTIIIAAVCSVGGLLTLLAAGILLYCRRRRRLSVISERPYSFGLPPQPDISLDPTSSGWVDGTWDPTENINAPQPALPHLSPQRSPLILRGKTTTDLNDYFDGTIASRGTAASDWPTSRRLNATSSSATREPNPSTSSLGSDSLRPSIRHPYATSGSTSRIVEDDGIGMAVVDNPLEQKQSIPNTLLVPKRSNAQEERPPRQSSLLATQGEAARARRQNSARSIRTVATVESPPPPYDRASPHKV
ncbi:hypothetical protein EIP86_009820 [Pleurotus ostreatoroseus]|nr:hypothetical protein EIP86_009820 [Pleurotus ostreatoroseus]